MSENMFKNSIHDLYNDVSSYTSASGIFGNKTVPNMAHTTDITCKGNTPLAGRLVATPCNAKDSLLWLRTDKCQMVTIIII